MEDFIKVNILNEQTLITKQDFLKMTSLLQADQIIQLKSVSIHLDEDSLKVLHIFTYYIIKVNKKIQIPNIQQFYQRQLNPYFIKKKLKFDILQLANICGKILNLKLQQCFHIIYYLIYGRLATSSYVEAISKSQGYLERKEKLKINTSIKNFRFKQTSNWQKKPQFQQTLSNTQLLKQQLKEILKPLKQESKIKKVQKIPEDRQDDQQYNAKIIKTNNKKYFNIFVPNRVQKNQKSAILESSSENGEKKGKFLRKKRFDQHYIPRIDKINDKIEKITKKIIPEVCSVFVQKQKKLNSKNFSKVIDQIRYSSNNLDKMRSSIEDNRNKLKKKVNDKYINNFIFSQNNYFKSKKGKQNDNQNSIKESQKNQTNENDIENDNRYANILQKNPSIKNPKKQIYGNSLNLMLFGKKQNRVFKFKSQYKNFLKNQLFQHSNDSL